VGTMAAIQSLESPMKKIQALVALLITPFVAAGTDMSHGADNFYTSDQVTVQRVTFKNQYQMVVAGNLFVPKNLDRSAQHAGIVVGHPMGAVKEQSANLYATKMAEQGFITLSIDLSFWGESEGQPRNVVVPDIYAEAFSAAVDYLGAYSGEAGPPFRGNRGHHSGASRAGGEAVGGLSSLSMFSSTPLRA